MKRGITVEDVPIPMGLRQAILVGLRQVLSLFLYNMLKISFDCCSSHLGTNDRILIWLRRVETRFQNGIVRGSYGYLWYGQVLGDYVDYVVSTQLLFCSWLNVVVIELFVIHCTCYISCVVQRLPIMSAMIVLWQVQ